MLDGCTVVKKLYVDKTVNSHAKNEERKIVIYENLELRGNQAQKGDYTWFPVHRAGTGMGKNEKGPTAR